MKLLNEYTSFRNAHIEASIKEHTENGSAFTNPGENAAIHAFFCTNILGYEVFVVETMPHENDFDVFIATVEAAGIDEMLICDATAGLMRSLQRLIRAKWQIVGAFEDHSHGYPIHGLRVKKKR